MSKAPVLALPNFTKQLILQTDTSRTGMGAVLIQEGHPISFFSKIFLPKHKYYSTYVR